MRRIKDTSKLTPHVRVVGLTERPVDPALVARALGAEVVTDDATLARLRRLRAQARLLK